MGSISFDASVKVKQGDIKGYRGHVKREHANPGNPHINPDKKHLNLHYSKLGNFNERIKARLENLNGARALRSDAVILRGLIFQPSPEMFEEKTDIEKQGTIKQFARDILPWVSANFGGQDNIMSVDAHLDETSPHLHVSIMPMTADGRLSQKDFFQGPMQLASMHKDLRAYMNTKGWEFDTANKYEDAKRFSEKEFRENASEIERHRQLKTEIRNLEIKKEHLKSDVRQEEAIHNQVLGDLEEQRAKVRQANIAVLEGVKQERPFLDFLLARLKPASPIFEFVRKAWTAYTTGKAERTKRRETILEQVERELQENVPEVPDIAELQLTRQLDAAGFEFG